MIPIDYEEEIDSYKQSVDKLISDIKSAIVNGYVGIRHSMKQSDAFREYSALSSYQQIYFDKAIEPTEWHSLSHSDSVSAPNSDLILDEQSCSFLFLFLLFSNDFLFSNIERLKEIVKWSHSYFPEFNDSKSVLSNVSKRLFVDNGYKNLVKKDIISATKSPVCPYCNRNFVYVVECSDESKDTVIKGQLDHFFPKEKYPFLAMSLYNLVPCCSTCNGESCKHNKDPFTEGIVSPYEIKDINALKFTTNIDPRRVFHLRDADSIVIDIDTSNYPAMANNNVVFHLKDIYNTHRDYAAEIIYKYTKTKTEAYKTFATSMFNSSEKDLISESDWERLYYGIYTDSKEQKKRPLSKFCKDILDDMKSKD